MEAVAWIGDREEYQLKVDILVCGEKIEMKMPKAEAWAAFPAILCARGLEELLVFVLQTPSRTSRGAFHGQDLHISSVRCPQSSSTGSGAETRVWSPVCGAPSEAGQGWMIPFHFPQQHHRQANFAESLGLVPQPAQPRAGCKEMLGWVGSPLVPSLLWAAPGIGISISSGCCAQAHVPGPAWMWSCRFWRWTKKLFYCLFQGRLHSRVVYYKNKLL